MEHIVNLEIVLKNPPSDVGFCLQKGRDELVDYVVSNGEDINFTFPVRVKLTENRSPNFLGEFTQGPVKERFVYICSGKRAGQKNTQWERRTKIHLSSMNLEQIKSALSTPAKKLKASYEATGKDGGPSCASVPLIGSGWIVEN